MGIFDFLRGGKSKAKEQSLAPMAAPANWRPGDAHLLFLSKFIVGQQVEHMMNDYWQGPLKELPTVAIQRFIGMGWLVPASLAAKMGSRFKAGDLKPLLKERNLRVSGRKDELIDRLIAADMHGMEALVKGMNVYECSPEAREVAEKYKLEQAQLRAITENKALEQLRARDFQGASLTVTTYEAKQVFSRGMGIEWSKSDTSRMVEQLESIFQLKPKILDGLAESEWGAVRVAAGMMALWGTRTAKEWLPEGFIGLEKFDADTTVRMLLFASNHKRELDSFKRLSGGGLRVKGFDLSGTDDSCPECKRLAKKRYRLSELPELPHAGCTHPYGCRCIAMPVFD